MSHRALGHQFDGEVADYEGRVGESRHKTRDMRGHLPVEAVAKLQGVRGEQPGEHTTRTAERFAQLKDDIAANGIKHPITIDVDYGQEPRIYEGNNRRDAALALGHTHVPVHVRYYGHAERL